MVMLSHPLALGPPRFSGGPHCKNSKTNCPIYRCENQKRPSCVQGEVAPPHPQLSMLVRARGGSGFAREPKTPISVLLRARAHTATLKQGGWGPWRASGTGAGWAFLLLAPDQNFKAKI